jgi:hypothetical protein
VQIPYLIKNKFIFPVPYGPWCIFAQSIVIVHPGQAAWCKNIRKGNKEHIAFIVQVRCHTTSEKTAKEIKVSLLIK